MFRLGNLKFYALFAIAAVAASLTGCYREQSYEGPGTVLDRGFLSYMGRYDIDVAPISLSESRDYHFELNNLPPEIFTVGLEVNSLPDVPRYEPVDLRITVRNEEDEIVIDEAAPLTDWVWGYAINGSKSMVYRRGEYREVEVRKDVFQPIPVDPKADGGHGSYFEPRPSHGYDIQVFVTARDNAPDEVALLKLHGVGK